MARKKPVAGEFALFDIIYEDGSQSSNRKIALQDLDAPNDLAAAKALIEQQDRKIEELSGRPRGRIKTIKTSGR